VIKNISIDKYGVIIILNILNEDECAAMLNYLEYIIQEWKNQ